MSSKRYSATALTDFASALLDKAGMESAKSKGVAEILVEGDLLGHNTHGLQLLAPYLEDIATALKQDDYDGVVSLESVYHRPGGKFEEGFQESVGRFKEIFG